jgi:hypothetical protein
MSLTELQSLTDLAQDIVLSKKVELVESVEQLEDERDKNEFFEDIASDYRQYQSMILQQKDRQKQELLKVMEYLDSLIETQVVTEYTLSHTQNEQSRLVNEIKLLQDEMDKIMI